MAVSKYPAAPPAIGSYLFRLSLRDILTACEKIRPSEREIEGQTFMTWKSKLVLGVLTALAMMVLTYALPRGGAMRDAALVQFPVTVGVWAIFVLLFVKLK